MERTKLSYSYPQDTTSSESCLRRDPTRRRHHHRRSSSAPASSCAASIRIVAAVAAAAATIAAAASFVGAFETAARRSGSSSPSSSSLLPSCRFPLRPSRPYLSSSSLVDSSQRAAAGATSSSVALRLRPAGDDDGGDGDGGYWKRWPFAPSRTTIRAGDTVFCKRSLPHLGIYENSPYQLTSIYVQYFDEQTQKMVKLPLRSMADRDGDDDDVVVSSARGGGAAVSAASLYVTLYSPRHHPGERGTGDAVVVAPEEVGVTSVLDEWGSAAWLAVPGLFWVYVALSFYGTYHDRTGGGFGDAFWGR
ncbi:hypothetical protein ACHAW5_004868 [Stephanodiscus triporus]|uniref:Uncharacterized protein n=1 Tax=Stephanodiscus triporus TaxID=2934178 RepID=A0ABD3NS69_9STRA